MKVSKMRKKARAAFKRWTCVWFLTDDGVLHPYQPQPLFSHPVERTFVDVVVIRGRAFTQPQAAVQRPT